MTELTDDSQYVKQVCDTYWARIYIAGPLHQAEDVCRKFAQRGECVNVYPTNYIFKHGEQSGVVVELINYPRFPKDESALRGTAKTIALQLCDTMCHGSFTIQMPDKTIYFDRRTA